MPYLGNNLEAAFKNYKSIDDISSSFNGSTTSFALQVNSLTPVPFPRDSQNCLISVGGVIQKPDATGTTGFKLSGTNIVFSSAPAIGESFFGIILAGADYVNAGVNYPDGTAGAPSITWSDDTDTGFYRSGAGTTSATANGNQVLEFASSTSGNFSVLSDLKLNDSKKIKIGTSDDLQIFHDGSNSYIKDTGTGLLAISASALNITNAAGTEDGIKFVEDGAVSLYYDNSKKFETTTYGNFFTGSLRTDDGGNIKLGTGNDLQIYHDGSHSYLTNAWGQLYLNSANDIQLSVASLTSPEKAIYATANGAVELYHDNEKKVTTSSSGLEIYGTDGGAATLDLRSDEGAHNADKFRLHVDDGGPYYIKNYTDGSWKNNFVCVGGSSNAYVGLYHNNVKEFQTCTDGVLIGQKAANGTTAYNSTIGAVLSDGWTKWVWDGATGTNTPFTMFNQNGSYNRYMFYVGFDGGIRNYQSNDSDLCDERAKKDIVDVSSQWDKVKQISIKNFKYKNDPDSDPVKTGVIAQQVETIYPDLVSDDWPQEDANPNTGEGTFYKSVKEQQLFMNGFKALQEAMTRIETLETKVAALESA